MNEVIMVLTIALSTIGPIFGLFFFLRSSKEMPKSWREFVIEIKYQVSGVTGLIDDKVKFMRNQVELVKQPNRVAVMTGGNRGIGIHVLEKLLNCEMIVVLGVRNPESSRRTVEQSIGELSEGKVFYETCDTGDMNSVRDFATKVQAKFPVIHLLVNNAGIMSTPYKVTKDGYESQMAVNYTGHFLLTHLLMPQIIAGSKDHKKRNARIINVSSCVHSCCDIDYEDFHCKKFYYPADSYLKSKLAQVLFTSSLETFFAKHNLSIQSHSVHPGIVNTELFEHTSSSYVPWMAKLYKTAEQGSRTIVYAAIAPELEGSGGSYLSNCAKTSCHESADDVVECQKLFDFTCSLLNIKSFGMLN